MKVDLETGELVEREVKADTGTLALISRAELDQQITTARAYPRSVKRFLNEAREMVTLTEEIAESCMYALPRGGKTIEGPSARFAEMVASAWGNCRAGARVVAEERDFVVAQGIFHDLERNVAITYEVKRRITNRRGERFDTDMIGVTGNAACAIALRNAVLKGVPKAFWNSLYQEARKVAVGTVETLANKRAAMLGYFQKLGVTEAMILAKLEKPGVEDIGLDELAVLKGVATSIKEGEITPEAAFAMEKEQPRSAVEAVKAGLGVPAPATPATEAPLSAPETPAPAPVHADAPVSATALLMRAERASSADELAEVQDLARGLSANDKRRIREACETRLADLSKGGGA